MSNHLTAIRNNFYRAKKELERALCEITQPASIDVLQNLRIDDSMAEVFKDKPVVIFQMQDIRVLQISTHISSALRMLEKIDSQSLKAIGTRGEKNGGC